MTKRVVIGCLGTNLDRKKRKEHETWRPTVSLSMQEELPIDRLDLLYEEKYQNLADLVTDDFLTHAPEAEVHQHLIALEDPWDFEETFSVLHDFTRQYSFNTDDEEYLVHITTGTHVMQICLFLLTEARYFPAKLIQTIPSRKKRGGVPGEHAIIDLDLSKYDQLASRFYQEAQDDISFLKSGIETKNRAFNELIETIERVAINSKEPILLTGPTGAGKSRLARRIYEVKKARRQVEGPFVEVNCATLRGDSAMSTLFGHKKGAFTGATVDRAGLLKTANEGVLFLDEVGELGLDEQVILLRAIEEKSFFPMGSDQEDESSFQLICGTNQDLHKGVTDGRFREDLLSRIDLWHFPMPGLKDRPEDIEPNLAYELDRFAQENGRRITFNKEAKKRFLQFATSSEAAWTANFRDLIGAVTRMSTLAEGGRINKAVVDDEFARLVAGWRRPEVDDDREILEEVLGPKKVLKLDLFDKAQLAQVLRVCQEAKNISEAGRKLFSESRKKKKTANDADRLRKYLMKFDLTWDKAKG